MQSSFLEKRGLRICKINVAGQKINGSRLETFVKIIALFQVDDKNIKFCFFEKTFRLANISMDVAFGMPFFILSNVEITFNNRVLRRRL